MGIHYPGLNGFFGTRATFMLDVIFAAMFLVLPILSWSIWLVRVKKNYTLHKRVQLGLFAALLLSVTLFEIDVRFVSGWRERAEPSPYYASLTTDGPFWDAICLRVLQFNSVPGLVSRALAIHLVFSITTLLLWTNVVINALKRSAAQPLPNMSGSSHRFWGWLTVCDTALTAVTGAIFYWLAFVS